MGDRNGASDGSDSAGSVRAQVRSTPGEPGGLLPRSFPADQLARFKKAGFALEAAQKQALKAQKGGGLSGMAVRGAPAS